MGETEPKGKHKPSNDRVREMIIAALFAAVIVVLSQISVAIPVSPVPITGQMLGVFLAGGILGSRLGSLSLLIYVLLGAIGLPVFAGAHGGITVLVGPTGGYIWGFILGSYVLGSIVKRCSPTGDTPGARKVAYISTALGMLACLAIVYLIGTIQLAIVVGIGLMRALVIGVLPFIPLDIAKLLIATVLSVSVRGILVRQRLL
ncbi:MAG TPA: biotin transporter BioY [Firmicutes bacterium]|nr:biotin transporter BioY [Bacillota bacterium]HHY98083.1 biotin transporter BioY [Bacillota bacterium]